MSDWGISSSNRDVVNISIAFGNAIVSLVAYTASLGYEPLRLSAIFSLILFGALLLRRLGNLYYFARTLFLGGIGYYPILIKVIAGPDARFAFYEPSTQGMEIVAVMYLGTSLAILGSEIGLFVAGKSKTPVASVSCPASEKGFWRTIFYAAIPVILWSSYATIQTAPTILTSTYASESSGQLLGNTQAIGIICLIAMFVAAKKVHIKRANIIMISIAIFFLIWAMLLRGMRQDVVAAIFGIVVCSRLIHGKAYEISVKNVLWAFAFIVVIDFMGVVRSLAAYGTSLSEMWETYTSQIFLNRDIYAFGTVSPISITYANIVYLIDSQTMDLLLGKSFWEFIPRTPPEFLYPGRPADYAWIFNYYGLGAGGGIFELAEAYMNFGLMGTIIVPAIISYLMAKAYNNVVIKQSVWSYFLLFSFLGVFLRGTWYQTFAFYKSFLTAVILYGVFVFAHFALGKTLKIRDAVVIRK